MPYMETEQKNCFRCVNLGASDDGYICNKGFEDFRGQYSTRTIRTGNLAVHCPLFDPREALRLPEAPPPQLEPAPAPVEAVVSAVPSTGKKKK